jgi:hypothetical protein
MTGPASLVSVSVRTAAAAAALLAVAVVLACGDSEEEVTQDPSLTPAASSTAPPVTTLSPTAAPTTPVPVPSDWKTYSDSVRAISLKYPPDLVLRDITPGGPQGEFGEQVLELRSPDKPGRAVVFSVFQLNPTGWSLDQFADEFVCTRDKREGMVEGRRALFCTKEVVTDRPESAVVIEYAGQFFAVTASVEVDATEFSALVQGFSILPR